MYFHKYEIELEYLDFWEELSKKLKVCIIEYVGQSSKFCTVFSLVLVSQPFYILPVDGGLYSYWVANS